MGDSVSKYYELVSEEEFDKAVKKSKKDTIDGLGVIEVFESEYPELSQEFKEIQDETEKQTHLINGKKMPMLDFKSLVLE